MDTLLNQIVNGLTLGSQYALIAAGLAILFGVLEIVNFAHGELYMVGAYVLYTASAAWQLPYPLAVVLTVAAMAGVGALFYLLVIRNILNRGWQVQLVATLAASIVLVNLAIVVEGSLPKVVYSPLVTQGITLGPVHLSWQRLLVLVAAGLTFAALASFLRLSRTGKAMRAVAQNRDAAAVVGINVGRVGFTTAVIAGVLCGVAAATSTPLYSASPTMGALVVVKAFAAVIVGGFGNVTGAVYAAFALGTVEALALGYLSSAYADVIVFGLMIVVLLVRPHGLFMKAVRV